MLFCNIIRERVITMPTPYQFFHKHEKQAEQTQKWTQQVKDAVASQENQTPSTQQVSTENISLVLQTLGTIASQSTTSVVQYGSMADSKLDESKIKLTQAEEKLKVAQANLDKIEENNQQPESGQVEEIDALQKEVEGLTSQVKALEGKIDAGQEAQKYLQSIKFGLENTTQEQATDTQAQEAVQGVSLTR
jgi:hypothetical protein